jgi:hypothetical protein
VDKPANLISERVLYAYLASVPNVVSKPSLGDSLEYTLNQMLSKSPTTGDYAPYKDTKFTTQWRTQWESGNHS